MKHRFLLLILTVSSFWAVAQQFQVNGNAAQLSCECYRLTQNVGGQGGSVWNNNQINLNNSFDYHFRVYLGNNDGGADGICFALQNANLFVGSTGGGMGYQGIAGQSIGIELDTYQNGGEPSYDHIALNSQGSTNHNLVAAMQASATNVNIEDGVDHDFNIVWDATTQTMSTYFDGVFRFSYVFAGGIVNSIFAGNPLVYWGFTGGTGALSNEQRFCIDFDANFSAGAANNGCIGTPTQFTSTSQSGLNSIVGYKWYFADGDSSTLQNPTHTYAAPNTYGVLLVITDQSLCTNAQQINVSVYDTPTVTPAVTNAGCFGGNTGQIALNVVGAGGYTYAWSPNNATVTQTASGLTAGTYNATVTDVHGCLTRTNATVTEPPILTLTADSTDVTCFGFSDGTITATATGGSGGYTYTASPDGVNFINNAVGYFTGFPAGTFTVTVSDANGCTATYVIDIHQPATPLAVAPTQTNVNCYGGNDGVITMNASGATPPYTYTWSPNVGSTDQVTNLVAGSYNVTVRDNNQCNVTNSFVITQPQPFILSETHVNVACNGDATGSITTSIQGGAGAPYTYVWSPNVSTTDNATNLPIGTYNVTVTDANNCTADTFATLTEPPLLTLNATVTDVTCFGFYDGTISATANGGVTPYTYTASPDGSNFINSATGNFTGFPAGSFNVVVADGNSCTTTFNVVINQPPLLQMQLNTMPTTCYGFNDGDITTIVTGGTPGYLYTLETGEQNDHGVFINLSTGMYTVTVTDTNSCLLEDSIFVVEPALIVPTILPDPAQVSLGSTIDLTTTVANGVGALTYTWSSAPGLSCYNCPDPEYAGNYNETYILTVTDANNCEGYDTVEIEVIPDYSIFIPNTFTPNNDNVNDFWQIFGNLKGIMNIDAQVFNRIGEKVFHSYDFEFKWDGIYQGKPVPPGVYPYQIKITWLDKNTSKLYKGTLTILR
jgi:gliding motility-associated-like protein